MKRCSGFGQRHALYIRTGKIRVFGDERVDVVCGYKQGNKTKK